MACLTPIPQSPFLNLREEPDHGALNAVQAALDDELSNMEPPMVEIRADEIEPILKALFRVAA